MEFTVKLNEQQLNVIGMALGDIPYKVAAPVIAAIDAQISTQQKPGEPTEPSKEKELSAE